jgi:hypothetical protein
MRPERPGEFLGREELRVQRVNDGRRHLVVGVIVRFGIGAGRATTLGRRRLRVRAQR